MNDNGVVSWKEGNVYIYMIIKKLKTGNTEHDHTEKIIPHSCAEIETWNLSQC